MKNSCTSGPAAPPAAGRAGPTQMRRSSREPDTLFAAALAERRRSSVCRQARPGPRRRSIAPEAPTRHWPRAESSPSCRLADPGCFGKSIVCSAPALFKMLTLACAGRSVGRYCSSPRTYATIVGSHGLPCGAIGPAWGQIRKVSDRLHDGAAVDPVQDRPGAVLQLNAGTEVRLLQLIDEFRRQLERPGVVDESGGEAERPAVGGDAPVGFDEVDLLRLLGQLLGHVVLHRRGQLLWSTYRSAPLGSPLPIPVGERLAFGTADRRRLERHPTGLHRLRAAPARPASPRPEFAAAAAFFRNSEIISIESSLTLQWPDPMLT